MTALLDADLAFDTAAEIASIPTKPHGPGALFQGLRSGTTAFAADLGTLFVLQVSSTSVNGTTVLKVSDDTSRRWKAVSGGGGGGVTIGPGEIGYGDSLGNVVSSPNLEYDDANQTQTVTGGTTFDVPALVIDAPVDDEGGFSSAQVNFNSDGTPVVSRFVFSTPDVPVASVVEKFRTTNALDTFLVTDSTDKPVLALMPNARDGGIGSLDVLATNATKGFVFDPTMNGTPTGIPANLASFINMAPRVVDTLHGRVYEYINGVWHYTALDDGGTAVGWENEEFAWSQTLGAPFNTLSSVISTDFNDGKAVGIGTLNTLSTVYANGVYQIGSGGASNVYLGSVANQIVVAAPKVDVWVASTKYRYTGSSFTNAKLQYVLFLFDLAGNGTGIWADQSISGTIFQLRHFYSGGAAHEDFALGANGTLGSAAAPVGAWFRPRMAFDGTSLNVYFGTTLARTLTGADLTHMVSSPSYLYLGGNDATIVANCDGMFASTIGN